MKKLILSTVVVVAVAMVCGAEDKTGGSRRVRAY